MYLFQASYIISMYYVPIYFEQNLGRSTTTVGLYLLAPVCATLVFEYLGNRVTTWKGCEDSPLLVAFIGAVVQFLASGLLYLSIRLPWPTAVIVFFHFTLVAGNTIIMTNINILINAVSESEGDMKGGVETQNLKALGRASNQLFRTLGLAVGVPAATYFQKRYSDKIINGPSLVLGNKPIVMVFLVCWVASAVGILVFFMYVWCNRANIRQARKDAKWQRNFKTEAAKLVEERRGGVLEEEL